jgi:hypothetical protein
MLMSFSSLPRRFLERVYGPEFASWELKRLHDFSQQKSKRDRILLGYCADPKDDSFALLPLPHLTQIYIDCLCKGIVLPPENAIIQVEGYWKPHSRKEHATHGRGWVFVVENITLQKDPYLSLVEPDISYDDFEASLFAEWLDMDPLVKGYLARELISSPPILNRVGGIANSLYNASPSTKAAIQLQKGLRQKLPQDLFATKAKRFKTLLGSHPIQTYSWHLLTGNSGGRLGMLTRERLLKGRALGGYREISVGLGNERKQPPTFSSPPVAGADVITILNEEASLRRSRHVVTEGPFDATKYMLTMHAFQPIITERVLSLSLSYLEDELNRIPKEYDLSPEIIANNAFLNINYWGRPASIIRLGLAEARLDRKYLLDFDTIRNIYASYENNFDTLYQAYQDILPRATKEAREVLLHKLSLTERRVWRTIDKLETCTFLELKIALHLPDIELQAAIETLSYRAIIYSPKQGTYKALHL